MSSAEALKGGGGEEGERGVDAFDCGVVDFDPVDPAHGSGGACEGVVWHL